MKELLFKKVEAIYILHDDGDMDFLEFRGSRISENLKNKIISKIVSFPECKPYLRNNSPIHIEGIFTFMVDTIPFEKTVSVEIENLQNYTFKSGRLGWINWDRFYDWNVEKVDLMVKVPRSPNVFSKLLFKNIQSVMEGYKERGVVTYKNVPINEPVQIIVMDEKNGKKFLSINETIIGEKPIDMVELDELALEEIKEKLDAL